MCVYTEVKVTAVSRTSLAFHWISEGDVPESVKPLYWRYTEGSPWDSGMASCLVSVKAISPLSTSPTAAWGLNFTSEAVNCQVLLSLTNWPDLGWRDTSASCSSLLPRWPLLLAATLPFLQVCSKGASSGKSCWFQNVCRGQHTIF